MVKTLSIHIPFSAMMKGFVRKNYLPAKDTNRNIWYAGTNKGKASAMYRLLVLAGDPTKTCFRDEFKDATAHALYY